MQIIENNPYRILGLLAGASAREQNKQIKRLKHYLEAEQIPPEDYSFPKLGKYQRTVKNIEIAASELNLDKDKMSAALFWFYNGNPITDDPAFDLMNEGKIKQTVSIWSKLTNGKNVEKRNSSAFQNLSTLLLNFAIKDGFIKEDILSKGVRLKLKFLESDYLSKFKQVITDKTYDATKEELQLIFLDQLHSQINKNGGVSIFKFLEIINQQNYIARSTYLKRFINKPIELIENKVKKAKVKRKTRKSNAAQLGRTLFEQTSEGIFLLKSILGISDNKFSSVSDNVANEILQCGIEHFNHFHETDIDPGNVSKELFGIASKIAVGNITKQRCQEQIENLNKWIDDKPNRQRLLIVKEDLKYLNEQIDKIESISNSIDNAIKFIKRCRPNLHTIKEKLGKLDETYRNISSSVVHEAQNMIIATVNNAISNYTSRRSNHILAFSSNLNLEPLIENALDVFYGLSELDMNSKTLKTYSNNLYDIKSVANQFGLSTLNPIEKYSEIENNIEQIEKEMSSSKITLREIEIFSEKDLKNANRKLASIKEWQMFRSQANRDNEIHAQQNKIQLIIDQNNENENEQRLYIKSLKKELSLLKTKLNKCKVTVLI